MANTTPSRLLNIFTTALPSTPAPTALGTDGEPAGLENSKPVVHFGICDGLLFEGFKPSCSVPWEQAWRKHVQGLALLSIWLAGSIWKGREDKRLLTCRAHSPDLDNLNTMWLDARHIWFMISLVFKGFH